MPDISLSHSVDLINLHTRLQPKVYIACLASHLKGEEHGEWVDANQSAEALKKAAQNILASSPEGEKAIHWTILKTEGFGNLVIDAFTSFKMIAQAGAFLAEYGKLGAMLINHFDDDLDIATLEKARYLIARGYHGVHPTPSAFVESFFPITPPLSLRIAPYIIHQLITQHLFSSYFFTLKLKGQLHIFSRYKTLSQFENKPLH